MKDERKCTQCGETKPTYAFYKKSGGRKIDKCCIKCRGVSADAAKSLQEGNLDPLMKLNNVSVFSYYLVTFLDSAFNEYTATINARTHLKLDSSFFDMKGFTIGGERVFWEVSIAPMSRDEYYDVHNSLSSNGREYHCPNLRIANKMSKREMVGIMDEFMYAIHQFHKNS